MLEAARLIGTFGPRRARRVATVMVMFGALSMIALVSAAPASAIIVKMRNDLTGVAISGVVPAGVANIDHCTHLSGNPPFIKITGYDLTVDVSNVNLSDGTVLTVTYGGTGTNGQDQGSQPVGTFAVSGGAGHFFVARSGLAGANDNIYVKHNGTIILHETDRWDTVSTTC